MEIGPTLDFWGHATRFALNLIERGRFLPTFVEENESGRRALRAHWRPVLSAEEDRARLRELGSALPFVCRTLNAGGDVSDEPPNPEPRELLGAFLENLTDATLRLRLAEAGFPDRGRRSQSRSAALTGALGSWLRSLAWIDDRIDSPPQSLEDFATEVRRWNQILVDPEGGTYRLLLQLLPPSAPEPTEIALASASGDGSEAPPATDGADEIPEGLPVDALHPVRAAEPVGMSVLELHGDPAGETDSEGRRVRPSLEALVPAEKSPWRIRL
jgi:hypothetical protein